MEQQKNFSFTQKVVFILATKIGFIKLLWVMGKPKTSYLQPGIQQTVIVGDC